jgi:hypothetical protein
MKGLARCLVLVALGAMAAVGRAQCTVQLEPGGDIPGISGAVVGGLITAAMTRWDPDGPGPQPELLVIGGSFTAVVDTMANHIAAWNPATGAWSALGTGCNATVADVAVLPSGALVAAGEFTSAGGVAAIYIAQWDGTSWSALGGGLNGPASCLAVEPSGDLLVGGYFQNAGATPARGVARWNGTAWSPLGNGPTSFPNDLTVLPNGHVVTVSRYGAVELWNGVTWQQIGISSRQVQGSTPVPGSVEAAVWAFGRLWVAGTFTHMNGVPTAGSAIWNGQTWQAANIPLPGVRSLSLRPNGHLLAAGVGTYSSSLWSFDGVQWTSLDLDTSWFTVEVAVDLPNGETIAGGSFGRVGTTQARSLVRWNGTTWVPFGSGLNAPVRKVVVLPSGDLVYAGEFTFAGGAPANRIARWNGAFQPLGTGFDDPVEDLVVLGNGDLVAGGTFGHAGPTAVEGVARFDGQNWVPLGSATAASGRVLALAATGSAEVLVGGFFASMGGVPASCIARWDGNSWQALGAGVSGWVYAVAAAPNGDVYAAGSFTTAGGSPAAGIARWNGTTWSPLGPGFPNGQVETLAIQPNGDLIAGGSFQAAVPGTGDYISRWNGTQWSSLGNAATSTVRSIEALPNGDLLVAADWFVIGNQQGPGLARWDGAQWHAVRLDIAGLDTLTVAPDGQVLLGGRFESFGAVPSGYFATASSTCPALANPFGPTCVSPTGPLVLSAQELPWLGGTCRTMATGFAANSLGAAVLGFSVPNTPLATLLPIGSPGCLLLASPQAVVLLVPQAGAASTSFALPRDVGLVGVSLLEQFLQLSMNAQNQPVALSGSNGLALVIGTY